MNRLAGLFPIMCFVLDIPRAPTSVQTLFGFLSVILLLGATTINMITIPSLVLLFILEISFVVLAYLRCKLFSGIPARDFFAAGALSFGICTGLSSVACAAWRYEIGAIQHTETQIKLASFYPGVYAHTFKNLDFAFHYTQCFAEFSSLGLSKERQEDAMRACSAAETVWYAQWSTPFAVPLINAISATRHAISSFL